MCLAIPMQIEVIEGFRGQCCAKGVFREVNLFLLQDQNPKVGDHVLVHLGYAIQVIAADEAHRYWEAFETVLSREAPRDA